MLLPLGRRKYIVEQIAGLGNCMVAATNIAPGEVIQWLEGAPHYLVTRSYVEKHWDAKNKEFFHQFAYPITDDLYVKWDPNPDNWGPINHSCDPNCWVTGLNLEARKHISKLIPTQAIIYN